MRGPYRLTNSEIDARVTRTAPGAYKLGNSKTTIKYVGRSDVDLNAELKRPHVMKYKYFWYEYATSRRAAFKKECGLYHYHGGDQRKLDNKIHPDRPDGLGWKCPVCKIFG